MNIINQIRFINPLYAIAALITTMGTEQVIVYGMNKEVIYSISLITEWALPYTMFTYGIILFVYAFLFKYNAIFVYILTYTIWDIEALQRLIQYDSINYFYMMFLIATIPSIIYLNRIYKINLSWKIFIIYFMIWPLVNTTQHIFIDNGFVDECFSSVAFALFLYAILKKKVKSA